MRAGRADSRLLQLAVVAQVGLPQPRRPVAGGVWREAIRVDLQLQAGHQGLEALVDAQGGGQANHPGPDDGDAHGCGPCVVKWGWKKPQKVVLGPGLVLGAVGHDVILPQCPHSSSQELPCPAARTEPHGHRNGPRTGARREWG